MEQKKLLIEYFQNSKIVYTKEFELDKNRDYDINSLLIVAIFHLQALAKLNTKISKNFFKPLKNINFNKKTTFILKINDNEIFNSIQNQIAIKVNKNEASAVNAYNYVLNKLGLEKIDNKKNVNDNTKIPNIPYKYKNKPLNTQRYISTKELFKFLVRKMYFSGRKDEFLTSNQIGNLIFNDYNSEYLKRIINEYKAYFQYEHNGNKKRLKYYKIYKEHPYIWTGEKINDNFSIKNIIDALDDEIREIKKEQSNKYLKIEKIQHVIKQGANFIYNSKVIIDDDNFFTLPEGIEIQLIADRKTYNITVLEFNNENETLSFQINRKLNFHSAKIKISTEWLVKKLKERIENFKPNNNLIWKLILKKEFPNKKFEIKNPYLQNLDNSQIKAINKSISNDITYIWGPPGTGKSHTLARLILNLLNKNEKTIVCSLANVAVDNLLLKTIDVIKEYDNNLFKSKKILRVGYSQSDVIRNMPEIKFENEKLIELASHLQTIQNSLNEIRNKNKEYHNNKQYILLLSKKDEIKKEYDQEIKTLFSKSNAIFLTASKFIIDEFLTEMEYDNLIIDEGSMMSIPYLLALGNKVKKRIIIAGDFKQLGPIAISKSNLAEQWLHKDLFSLLDNKMKHNALTMLNEQRRTAKDIVELINEFFYDNKLKTIPQKKQITIKNLFPKGHIHFINLEGKEQNISQYSNNKSKYNNYSIHTVLDLISKMLEKNEKENFKIGIITPYRQQVLEYQKKLETLSTNDRIKVGTIHTFQGSESDIIIWDIVDAKNQSIGKIYKGIKGERLVNVAISRAIGKLIIVGDRKIFNEGDGRDTVSSKLKGIINRAWEYYLENNR